MTSRAIRPFILFVFLLLLPVTAAAQSPSQQPAVSGQQVLKPEELDALVAPIALYPDNLLAQVLMASTYPAEGYRAGGGRAPFHGYYFKILTKQGPNAPGGALDYVVGGKMIGGFALVAYPAEYGNSGVKTFLVSHSGVVFEKDLGSRTAGIAERMTSFNPDQTWKKVAISAPLQ